MSAHQHFTTRRGFVAGVGFGGLGLYATWAAYGASPLPFAAFTGPEGVPAHAGHGMAADGQLAPAAFMRRHAEFLTRFQEPDGAVRPAAAQPGGMTASDAHAPTAPMTPMAMDMTGAGAHAGHGGMAMPAATPAAGGHDHAAMMAPAAPIEIYVLAERFAFAPDQLRLAVGQSYRFQMMSRDVAHGVAFALGRASRIVRLRPDRVTTLDLSFQRAGTYLVYCTAYCGPGHDGMHGQIIVG